MSNLTAIVDGRTWRTYCCEFSTPDGNFGFTIMAISMEHAAAMLADLKATAVLSGELHDTFPA